MIRQTPLAPRLFPEVANDTRPAIGFDGAVPPQPPGVVLAESTWPGKPAVPVATPAQATRSPLRVLPPVTAGPKVEAGREGPPGLVGGPGWGNPTQFYPNTSQDGATAYGGRSNKGLPFASYVLLTPLPAVWSAPINQNASAANVRQGRLAARQVYRKAPVPPADQSGR